MALIDKLTAIANGFRASRGTTVEYSLDEMAVLASEPTGGTKLTLFTPSISLNSKGTTLSITDQNGGFAESYDLYVNGEFNRVLKSKSVTLANYIEYEHGAELKVQAKSENFNPSEISNVVLWYIVSGTPGLAYSISSDGTYARCTGIGDVDLEEVGYEIIIGDMYEGVPVTEVDGYSFGGDSDLESVVIPDSVTSIGDCAFDSCWNLYNIELGENVRTIGYAAFSNCCDYLNKIAFPSSVEEIGDEAFQTCYSLSRVDFSNHTIIPTLGQDVFFDCDLDLQIKVPADLIDEWKNATNWSEYADCIVTEFTN